MLISSQALPLDVVALTTSATTLTLTLTPGNALNVTNATLSQIVNSVNGTCTALSSLLPKIDPSKLAFPLNIVGTILLAPLNIALKGLVQVSDNPIFRGNIDIANILFQALVEHCVEGDW